MEQASTQDTLLDNLNVEVASAMRTPALKKTILRMVGRNEFYGYEVHQELAEKNIKIGIGRLYSILGEMKSDGLLKDRWEKSKTGPRRRVYRIAPKGEREREKILMEAIWTVHDFYIEYLLSLPPELSAFNAVARQLTKGIGKKINIGYATSKISGTIKRLIRRIQEERPNANIYAVCPKTSTSDLELEGILFLDGALEDIPTKDNYLDLLVVTGNIEKNTLDTCMAEWRRVLGPKGKLAIVTPTALITNYSDPLGIGEFIEIREHPPPEGANNLDVNALKSALERNYRIVKEEKIVHITVLTGVGAISN
ncbi:MAG: helix-turn-helix transcriptional regulator [Candidatus Thorarchaeota archaeon]|jgi:PadR family transcriptional regulator PadR